MDNITHSLAGLLLADAVVQLRARRIERAADAPKQAHDATESARTFVWTAALLGVIGANLPDLDVPWGMLLQALGRYDEILLLLHHRGRTHTLLACAVAIPMLWGVALLLRRLYARSRGEPRAPEITGGESSEPAALLLIATLAVLSHLLLDFTNDYGVHPLSPFMNEWFYGDTIFIIEPWLWIAAVPPLLRSSIRSRGARITLWGLLTIAVTLSWIVPQVSTAAAVGVSIGVILSLVVSRRLPVTSTARAGIGSWVLVTACFSIGTSVVRAEVIDAKHADAAHVDAGGDITSASQRMQLLDVVTGANPANPLCARIITVEANAAEYRLTTGWASAVPRVVSAQWCSRAASADTTRGAVHLPMMRATAAPTAAIEWTWTWSAPRAELVKLARENCQVSAWLQFVRVPFWIPFGTDSVMVGDLRYDRDARASVARYTLPRSDASCPGSGVPWERPRADVWPSL